MSKGVWLNQTPFFNPVWYCTSCSLASRAIVIGHSFRSEFNNIFLDFVRPAVTKIAHTKGERCVLEGKLDNTIKVMLVNLENTLNQIVAIRAITLLLAWAGSCRSYRETI